MGGTPETKYARSGDVHIAYQVTGEGSLDLVVAPTFVSHLEAEWDEFPQYRRFYERLGRYLRVIRFDKRGAGLSDRVGERAPTVDERMDDIRAVMDAAGSTRAALLGLSEGGRLAVLFCATFPERVASLLLFGANARSLTDADYEQGFDPELVPETIAGMEEVWGTGFIFSALCAPSIASDPGVLQAAGRVERLSASPGTVKAIMQMNAALDVRHVLELVRGPVLVMHRRDDMSCAVAHGRYLAEHIPGSRFVEYPGADHLPWFGENADQITDDMVAFFTGRQAKHSLDASRVLATVLFTDIVDSTRTAASLGDRRWRDLLERHDSTTRAQVDSYGGHLVKSTGDGCLATFDGPGRAVRCAATLRDTMRTSGIEIRAGLHSGEVEILGDDIGGIAVHIGARVVGAARPGDVLVSRTVVDLVAGSGIDFEDRGEHELKGVPGAWKLFALVG